MACLQGAAIQSFPVITADKQVRWYAAYTRANHERRVAEGLNLRSIETFLPLYEEMHEWKDRLKRVKIPLFAGYVFVRIALESRSIMYRLPGFVRLVGFDGMPAPIQDQQIESLRSSLNAGIRAEPFQQQLKGMRVRIRNGPFAGFEGFVVRQRKTYRLVISIDLIQRAVLVDVDPSSIVIESAKKDDLITSHRVEEDSIVSKRAV